MNKPLTTITTKQEHCLIAPTILVNTTGHSGSRIDEPIKTITTGGQHALVTSVLSASLKNRSQSVYAFLRVARCGNSVPPPFAEQLVRANLPEMCVPEHMNKYYCKAN